MKLLCQNKKNYEHTGIAILYISDDTCSLTLLYVSNIFFMYFILNSYKLHNVYILELTILVLKNPRQIPWVFFVALLYLSVLFFSKKDVQRSDIFYPFRVSINTFINLHYKKNIRLM